MSCIRAHPEFISISVNDAARGIPAGNYEHRIIRGASACANNDVLTAALRIHSVEARHAAHIRQMRKANGGLVPAGVNVKPWITLNQSGIGSAVVQASYDGEEITTQATISIVNINEAAQI